jgi:HPt (histidine-containing phosphotransfer) domain-containing protein
MLAEAGDESLVQEVLSVYRTDTAERMAKLKAAVAREDRAMVKNQAHAIKGSSGQVGAVEVAAHCRELELGAMTAAPEVLRDLVGRAEAALVEVLRVMPE